LKVLKTRVEVTKGHLNEWQIRKGVKYVQEIVIP
jgi:hypothetical protein